MKDFILIIFIWMTCVHSLSAQMDYSFVKVTKYELSLTEAMSIITDVTGKTFSYTNRVNLTQTLKFEVKTYPLAEILQVISRQTGYEFNIRSEGKIVLYRKNIAASDATISGFIRDKESGEALIGATIFDERSKHGSATNVYGFYSLTLPKGEVHLHYSYIGHESKPVIMTIVGDTLISIGMGEGVLLQEVIVESEKQLKIHETSQTSSIKVPIRQIINMPTLNGEVDLMKSLQLLPGVQAGSEGNAGMYVRGGGPDQNLILMDGVPIYNATHLYGFYSIFNADAINNVELIKGGFPARYGGRLSSVVDINMKEGNMYEYHGNATLGMVTFKGMLEGPIIKNKASFMLTGRTTYWNPLIFTGFNKQARAIGNDYNFYDLNTKVNYKINSNNRIFISAYMGQDQSASSNHVSEIDSLSSYQYDASAQITWGNRIATMRWNHVFSNKVFSTLSMSYNQYNFKVTNESQTDIKQNGILESTFANSEYKSGIRDLSFNYQVEYIPNAVNEILVGMQYVLHRFSPEVYATLSSSQQEVPNRANNKNISPQEYSAFIEDDISITPKLKSNVGLRFTSYQISQEDYLFFQPRISIRYLLSKSISIKSSYSGMQQNVHLLTNSGIGLPTDLWLPATVKAPPQYSHQFVLGGGVLLRRNLELSVETYYKTISNLIEYKNGASYLMSNLGWENLIERGRGNGYGLEVMLQKKTGKLSGWLGYTLSWSNRQFDNLNEGHWYPYKYDRRHDIKIVGLYQLNEHFDFSANWVFGTGNAVTIPAEAYSVDFHRLYFRHDYFGSVYTQYSYPQKNNYRMRDYHRIDVSVRYSKEGLRLNHQVALSIYNLYNRQNPYYLEFTSNRKGKKVLRQNTLYGIIPSASYTLSF